MSVLAVPGRRAVLADLVPGALARDIALVVAGAGLTGLAAQVALPVPGSPVPITGQTFAALLVGAALGWRRGGASMALYLVAGVAGVPWFQGASSGLPASLGYVVGFVLAGALVGHLAARGGDRTPLRTVGTMALGNLAIYACGVPWLMAAAGVGFGKALQLGVTPFLLGDVLKIALAAGLLPAAWALVKLVKRK
ncbi:MULTISPECIES: biotin transporter BioY [Saccharothrix]|uniref:Biotin transporter n=1 Tax=Saccharothrix yanglingensis TaxID=659496 RepID=A0ABU0X5E7_9PSEU|nr:MULTISPECIES: biotin transporter BioY [Saccharothrix]MBY8848471.1 biotin transporter BioY [Saccharothrix sp. MB29]MDQ2587363.1 biotin transporter BioY [Saccharothrix yanglingensis]MDU0292171.1 biotin transporter BioY [Saccharothrix longispora]